MTDPPRFTASSASDHDFRAGDADREASVSALQRAHIDGRLDTNELQDRLGRALTATWASELADLVGDLPREHAITSRVGLRAPRAALLVAIVILALLVLTVGPLAVPLFFFTIRVVLMGRFGGWSRPRRYARVPLYR